MLTQPTHLTFEEIRANGAYYTNEDNILKVINPLFLEDLNDEFESVKAQPDDLRAFHEKISNLKFLDPASGCGNFLIVTYLELTKLEAKIIEILAENGLSCDFKVNLSQFYGIEIDPVACQNSKENMKAIDSQITEQYKAAFPNFARKRPNSEPCIVATNALRIDWNEVVSKDELNYIIGNPPFVGYHLRTPEQREDMDLVFGKNFKWHGILDYVAAWFKKASDYMKGTQIEAAFVSTNSISQGQQPAVLWTPLIENNNAEINFAYRPFKWTNEKNGKKAQVHCVIIGFSDYKNGKKKKIFMGEGEK